MHVNRFFVRVCAHVRAYVCCVCVMQSFLAACDLLQRVRPSWHSALPVLSNAIFLYAALRWRPHVTVALAVLLACAVSTAYHVCDEHVACIASLERLHLLDACVMFGAACVAAVAVAGYGVRAQLGTLVAWLPASFALLDAHRYSLWANAVLWGSVIALALLGMRAASDRQPRAHATPVRASALRVLRTPLALLLVALACFVAGNMWMRVTRDSADALVSLPETHVYWALHSAWHVLAGMALASLASVSAQR
jgi:hypothetical protein